MMSIRPSIAAIAALDSRVEEVIRRLGECKLGEIASDSSVKEVAIGYASVVNSLKRLHAAGRITQTGMPKARRYSLKAEVARMTSVKEREPKLGDMVWALDGSAIVYGQLVGIRQRLGEPVRYELDPSLGMDSVTRVELDGCKLVRIIEATSKEH